MENNKIQEEPEIKNWKGHGLKSSRGIEREELVRRELDQGPLYTHKIFNKKIKHGQCI